MESEKLFSYQMESTEEQHLYYSSGIVHCLNKLNTVRRKCCESAVKNDPDSLQSLRSGYSDSVELDKIIYINGSSTSIFNQGFLLSKSLKHHSLLKQKFLSQENLFNSEVPTAFNKCFAKKFNFDSYD